jgi:hypothetical protein
MYTNTSAIDGIERRAESLHVGAMQNILDDSGL